MPRRVLRCVAVCAGLTVAWSAAAVAVGDTGRQHLPWGDDLGRIREGAELIAGGVASLLWQYSLIVLATLLLTLLALALFGTRTVVKWPVVLILGGVTVGEMVAYFVVRAMVYVCERLCYTSESQRLRRLMDRETDYARWVRLGEELDRAKGLDGWRRNGGSESGVHGSRYNWPLIRSLTEQLRRYRTANDADQLMQVLSQCTRRNLGGIWAEQLYSVSYTGRTKDAIHTFAAEVVRCMRWLGSRGPLMSPHRLQRALRFVDRVRRAYGETGLFLSGGASNGNYHWGVVRALLDLGCLPRYISGTSAGAVVSALLATRTDEELHRLVEPGELRRHLTCFDESWAVCLQRFARTGTLFSRTRWRKLVCWFTRGDMTFREAYERTGRTVSINVSETGQHGTPVMLNHDTAPDVVIHSAVLASSAMQLFLRPQQLLVKRADGTLVPRHDDHVEEFVDGCFTKDTPVKEMAELYNIQFSVVSQVNPHVAPFYFKSRGEAGDPSRWRRRTGGWRGGFILSALETGLKHEMVKNIMLMDCLGLINNDGVTYSGLFLQNFEGDITVCYWLRDSLLLSDD